jgi:hypothetical protein
MFWDEMKRCKDKRFSVQNLSINGTGTWYRYRHRQLFNVFEIETVDGQKTLNLLLEALTTGS